MKGVYIGARISWCIHQVKFLTHPVRKANSVNRVLDIFYLKLGFFVVFFSFVLLCFFLQRMLQPKWITKASCAIDILLSCSSLILRVKAVMVDILQKPLALVMLYTATSRQSCGHWNQKQTYHGYQFAQTFWKKFLAGGWGGSRQTNKRNGYGDVECSVLIGQTMVITSQ